jgi:6-phosphogluconolactonase
VTREIRIEPTVEAVALAAASEFTQQAAEAVNARGLFAVALSGGSTPRALYSLLASDKYRNQVPWDKTHFFWGDERDVPLDHPDSNYRMADDAMLSKVPAPSSNVHRVRTEVGDAVAAAAQYEEELRKVFHIPEGEFPRFDLVLLGMGPDGHTASLFPGTEALGEQHRLVVANRVEKFGSYRITMTLPVLNNAACVMFLVTGEDKAQILKEVLEGEPGPYPSQLIQPVNGRLLWLVEQNAASLLQSKALLHGQIQE